MAGVEAKRVKLEPESGTCIICSKKSPLSELSKPAGNSSWKTLCDAAAVRNFYPIIKLVQEGAVELPSIPILYHRACRSYFNHKKHLAILTNPARSSSVDTGDAVRRRPSRKETGSTSRVYDAK
ncbi:Uncharacterised protein g4482 [Pycnogonum litorale]